MKNEQGKKRFVRHTRGEIISEAYECKMKREMV